METVGGRMFINFSLESSVLNIANLRNTEKPKPRRKPSTRNTERLKTFNAKKAAAAEANKDATSEESPEVQNFSDGNGLPGNQQPTDKEKDIEAVNVTEKPVDIVVVLDNSENKSDKVPPTQMETKLGEDFLYEKQQAAAVVLETPMALQTADVNLRMEKAPRLEKSMVSMDRLEEMERLLGMGSIKGDNNGKNVKNR